MRSLALSTAILILGISLGFLMGRRPSTSPAVGPGAISSNGSRSPGGPGEVAPNPKTDPLASPATAPADEAELAKSLKEAGRLVAEQMKAQRIVRATEAMALRLNPTYKELFDRFGLDSTVQEQLFAQLHELYEKKLQADSMANDLSGVISEYTLVLERQLGTRYAEYEAFENGDKARRQLARIAAEFTEVTANDPVLTELILKAAAYDQRTQQEPGTALNRKVPATTGRPAILALQRQMLDDLKKGSASLLEAATRSELSPAVTSALRQYYEKEIAALEAEVVLSEDRLKSRADPHYIPAAIRSRLEQARAPAPR